MHDPGGDGVLESSDSRVLESEDWTYNPDEMSFNTEARGQGSFHQVLDEGGGEQPLVVRLALHITVLCTDREGRRVHSTLQLTEVLKVI